MFDPLRGAELLFFASYSEDLDITSVGILAKGPATAHNRGNSENRLAWSSAPAQPTVGNDPTLDPTLMPDLLECIR